MATAAIALESLTLNISEEIHVAAPLDTTFAALLEQLGPASERPDGTPLSLKLEAWPGGRWFRDLGDNEGHCWGFVQAIKRPTLLELSGPLFMSYPAISNVQYRLSEEAGGTLIQFHHTALGLIQEDHRKNVGGGWSYMNSGAKARAEKRKR
jgi:hypothetical protein